MSVTPVSNTSGVVRSALAWNAASFVLTQGVAFGVFLFLAHRLTPAAFGVFALALVGVDLLAQQAKSAVSDLLVQRHETRPGVLSSLFWAFTIACTIAAAALAMIAAPLGVAFGAPELATVLPWLALVVLLTPGLAIVEALALQKLAFRAFAARNMAASLIGALAAVITAIATGSVLALAAQRIAASAIGLIALQRVSRWRPQAQFDIDHLKPLLRPAAALFAGQALNLALARICDVIIGMRLGVSELGLYRVADRFVEMVHAAATAPIATLWTPLMARLRNDPAAGTSLYLSLMALAALVAAPAFVGLALTADDLTTSLLDPRYDDAAPVLALLAIGGLAIPFAYFRSAILIGLGRNRWALWLAVFDLAATTGFVIVGASYGLSAATAGMLGAAIAAAAASQVAVSRAMGVTTEQVAGAVAPALLAAGLMGAFVLTLQGVLAQAPAPARLAVSAIGGSGFYAAALWALWPRWLAERLATMRPEGRTL